MTESDLVGADVQHEANKSGLSNRVLHVRGRVRALQVAATLAYVYSLHSATDSTADCRQPLGGRGKRLICIVLDCFEAISGPTLELVCRLSGFGTRPKG